MLRIYNTITRKKEFFKVLEGKKINLFVCGPTVYDFPHIGHARIYLIFDMIVKYLKQKGFSFFYLQNITDIDDKIIKRAEEKKITIKELTDHFRKIYLKDMRSLKISSVTKYAKATKHIKEIISQVERLLEKKYAYRIDDGIYYDISRFKDYGKLSRRTALQAEDAVSRIDESKGKRNKGDFCLWKFSKPNEPNWESPWGLGRPGWHIEDTAITEKYFGSRYDLHGGGQDLIFPHHEAEIAQMEAISGKKPLVRYWLHVGFLTVNGGKMSKSLGNFITIRDFLKKNSPRILRFLLIRTHYRSPIDYSEKNLSQAKKEIERIDEFVGKLKEISANKNKTEKQESTVIKNLILTAQNTFERAMDDNFNTPKAIALIFHLTNKINTLITQNSLSSDDARNILSFLRKIDKIFHFIFLAKIEQKIPENVLRLVKKRENYRQQKNWRESDEIREKIKTMGWCVEDTKKGTIIKQFKRDS